MHRRVSELLAMSPPLELECDFPGLLELNLDGKTHCKISLTDGVAALETEEFSHCQRCERQSTRNILKETHIPVPLHLPKPCLSSPPLISGALIHFLLLMSKYHRPGNDKENLFIWAVVLVQS